MHAEKREECAARRVPAPQRRERGVRWVVLLTASMMGLELLVGYASHSMALLCTGMVDEMLPLPGFRELWGHAIIQCPYCHGWESKERPWGYLARAEHVSHLQPFATQLRGWTKQVCVFTNGALELAAATCDALVAAGVRIETAPISALAARDQRLEAIELSDGSRVACELLFVHPPQRQVELVSALGATLDGDGFVQVDPMTRETSVPGVFRLPSSAGRWRPAFDRGRPGRSARVGPSCVRLPATRARSGAARHLAGGTSATAAGIG